jgi:hypothetical protein
MSLNKKKINNITVHRVNLPKIDNNKIKGFDMIPELYANIYVLARKKQGKTTVLYNIIKECINKYTKVFFFVSTIDFDPTYKEIMKYLDDHDIEYEKYDSLNEKENTLTDVMDQMKENVISETVDSEDDEKEEDKKPQILNVSEDDETLTVKIRKYKPRKLTPRHLLIFDDISDEMRNNKTLRALMKKNRHYKSKIIISTQHFTDVNPDIRKMFDIWLLFRDHDDKILKDVYDACCLNISYDQFHTLYKDATKDMFNFLFVDKNKCDYRHNFDFKYNL